MENGLTDRHPGAAFEDLDQLSRFMELILAGAGYDDKYLRLRDLLLGASKEGRKSLDKVVFTPEFRNRLDAIVNFGALNEDIILRVVDKFLLQLETQLAEKKVEVTFTDKLRKHLAKKGFDPLMGARPMQRLIQDTIRRSLADELLFGRLTDGGRLTVDMEVSTDEKGVETGEVKLDIQPLPKKEGKAGKSEPAEPEQTAA